jgi:hypothetical protein
MGKKTQTKLHRDGDRRFEASLPGRKPSGRRGRTTSAGGNASNLAWTHRKPGSDEAIAAGCICPVLDNSHGKGDGPFRVIEGCPIHDPQPPEIVLYMR